MRGSNPGTRDLRLAPGGVPSEPVVVVDASAAAVEVPAATDRVVVVVADRGTPPGTVAAADVVLTRPDAGVDGAVECADPWTEAERVVAAVAASPVPAVSLGWLLRGTAGLDVPAALAAESALYSALLGGADFARWLAARRPARDPGPSERIRFERDGDELTITLARPACRNAVDAAMRDSLVEALQLARWDPALRVTITADGPDFSAGGDLDEFGMATDLALAHVVRVAGGAGRLLHELRDRVTVRVHGACIGAGCELPAFAGRVAAAPSATFRLPEVAMGLIPGAGGTVSLPRRIGRTRTAWLALTGETIDAATALAWGLVDEVG